ncbi:MAG: cytochrome c biogenesis protein CcsA [Saprospiraceae bacterium]|nr:cytochrome c biogenesis protein CcsA [Saprospiraceae bacterium]
MPDIQYLNEHLLPRQIGHAAILLSFVSALVATIAYFFATQNNNKAQNAQNTDLSRDYREGSTSWQKLGRWAFVLHGISVGTVIFSIFYVMVSKKFEYFYAHSHVDTELPFQYVFAAFWEGQEGSFLLWMFWHVVLGGWLILRNQQLARRDGTLSFENPVLATLASIQVFLGSMILGLHFGFGEHIIKWGSNPILLLRETMDAPLFSQPDYVEKLAASAKGLNPLLQNYWMTIHPPTLFLGFASTSIPFCFAIAGLWTRRYTEWLRPAMGWALFSAMILGTGILMGGAWAYEALSFNGYWAWDPVENMSLVPWIVLVAGLHTHVVANATGHSIRATFGFYILTFLLTLYSTFLTRSGILGDTSAHAFTEMGLEWQLVLLQMFFLIGGLFFLIKHWKNIPAPDKEEAITSREFWLFIGSLVLILSVVLMSFTTSIPVFNKILGFFSPSAKKFTAPVDVLGHYNKTQLWIAVFMGFLSAITQFLRFREANFEKWLPNFTRHLLVTSGLALGFTLLLLGWIEARDWTYWLMLFAGVFTAVANIDYAVSFMRKNLKAAGSAMSHVGFGVLVVGILAFGVNKKWISSNRFAMEGLINFSEEQFNKNVLLVKGSKLMMNDYIVSYDADTTYGTRRDYTINFRKMDMSKSDMSKGLTGAIISDSFSAHPYILFDKKTGKVASPNPDTRHFLTYDVFSYIAALPPTEQDPEIARQTEDSLHYHDFSLAIGETIKPQNEQPQTPQYMVRLDKINPTPKHPKYIAEEKDVAIGVKMTFFAGKDSIFSAEPLVLLRENNIYQLPVTVNQLQIRVKAGADIFDKLFEQQKDLKYDSYVFSQGQTQKINGQNVTFEGVDAAPKVDNFKMEAQDLAFAAKLRVNSDKGTFNANPIFIIRGNKPMPLKDDIAALGMSFVIGKVNPDTKQITIEVAKMNATKMPISIAEDAPRTDYIVLEATLNPGINIVWLGCILMLLGLGIAMIFRIRQKFS